MPIDDALAEQLETVRDQLAGALELLDHVLSLAGRTSEATRVLREELEHRGSS